MLEKIIKRIIRRLRREFFPTEHDRIVDKWQADGSEYKLRLNYDLNQDSLVMDLGGYQGQWASDIVARYLCSVLVFEPVSSFAQFIEERFRRNDKIKVHRFGLGGSTRKETISICAAGSSIFRESSQKEDIQIVDVAQWFAKEEINSVDLMKINIEGSEYELLERMLGTHLIDRIKNIQVQFHNVSEDSVFKMHDIQSRLKETHTLTYQYKFIWENWVKKRSGYGL